MSWEVRQPQGHAPQLQPTCTVLCAGDADAKVHEDEAAEDAHYRAEGAVHQQQGGVADHIRQGAPEQDVQLLHQRGPRGALLVSRQLLERGWLLHCLVSQLGGVLDS